jgi:hypothetical protein
MAKKRTAVRPTNRPAARSLQRRYDATMIRHFLEHLLWEVRIVNEEYKQDPVTPNPELVEILARYSKMYGTALLEVTALDPSGLTEEQFRRLRTRVGAQRKEMFAAYLAHLEALTPLFEEALLCAGRGGLSQRVIRVRDIPEAEGGEGGGEGS